MNRLALFCLVLATVGCGGGSGAGTGLVIEVYNDTVGTPLANTAEILVNDANPISLAKLDPEDVYRGHIATSPPYFLTAVSVYPDTRDGKEIRIPVMMTRDMSPSNADPQVMIEITDTEVIASGEAVLEASDGEIVSFSRFDP